MARLYVPHLYRLQQKILKASWDHVNGHNGGPAAPSIDELVLATKKPKALVLRVVNILIEKGLVMHNPQSDRVFCSKSKGEMTLLKEEILEEGWEKFKVNLLRWMQIVGIISASSIGIATFILTYTTTNSNKVEIGKLQKEIEYLKQKSVPVRYLPERPKVSQPVRDSLRKK